MPGIKLAVMIVVHVHSMSGRRYHFTQILPTQMVTQVNHSCCSCVDSLLKPLNNVLVLAPKIAQLKGQDIFFDNSIEVNHVGGMHLVVLDVECVHSHFNAKFLILLDIIDDISSVVVNPLWMAVRRLE